MQGLLLVVLFGVVASASILDYEVTYDDSQEEDTASPDLDRTPEQYEEVMLRLSSTPTTTDLDEWAELFRVAAEEAIIHRNLTLGHIGAHDILLSKTHHYKSEGDTNVAEDVYFRGLPTTIITAIRGGSVSENARPSVLAGGVGHNHVCIRLHSPKGRGYKYSIEIYGRK